MSLNTGKKMELMHGIRVMGGKWRSLTFAPSGAVKFTVSVGTVRDRAQGRPVMRGRVLHA